jgi:hypothetical protein
VVTVIVALGSVHYVAQISLVINLSKNARFSKYIWVEDRANRLHIVGGYFGGLISYQVPFLRGSRLLAESVLENAERLRAALNLHATTKNSHDPMQREMTSDFMFLI